MTLCVCVKGRECVKKRETVWHTVFVIVCVLCHCVGWGEGL